MKQFFKMMFASILGVFAALGLVLLVSVCIAVSWAGSMGTATSVYVPQSNTVFKISLSGSMVDNGRDTNPLVAWMEPEGLSLRALLEAIEKAKENDHIKGIYLEANGLSTGSANRQAIRRALAGFKESGKFVVAYGDYYTQGDYFLCSIADKVFVNPQGLIELTGFASQTMFYKGLAEKAGVKCEVFKVGAYKGAVEPYILDKLSDANREQINSYLSSVWKNVAAGISEGRGLTVEAINRMADEGVFFAAPSKMVEYGLADELKYKYEAEEYVKELAGQTHDKLKTVDLNKLKNIKVAGKEKGAQIAVLYAEGQIQEDNTSPFDGSTENIISENMVEELAKLKDNEDIKAVVFRVNSPGGSAYISEQIWRQVSELKKVKPIVVSMGNLAASGGYYISCAASRIVAEPATLTGSIGIFALVPIIEGTLQKAGITVDAVTTNRFSDFGNLARPFREDEKALFQAYIERGYDLFVTRCAEGRGMTKEEINAIGQGRVWTGEQAKEIGLVDELGGIESAVESAAALAGLTDYRIVNVSGSKDFWQDFIERQLNNLKVSVVKSVLGKDYEYVRELNDMRSSAGSIQARIPYDMRPL
jgi:protease-4